MLIMTGLLALALLMPRSAEAKASANLAPDPDDDATVSVQDSSSQSQDVNSLAQDAGEKAVLAKYRQHRQDAERTKMLGFSFEVETGYTYLQMDDFNKVLNIVGATPMHSALLLGADAGVTLFNDMLEIGPRIEYIYAASSGNCLISYMGSSGGGSTNYSVTYEASLVPVTLGVRYKTHGVLSALASVDVGEGWAKLHATHSIGPDYTYAATCPVVDARVGLRAGRRFHVQMEAGYRRALVDMGGNYICNLDFSGYLGDVKLGYDF